ncbi:MAG: methyltransferase [Planctomycetaceae bacterium]
MPTRSKTHKSSRRVTVPSPPRGIPDRLLLNATDEILPPKGLLVLVSGTALAKHLVNLRRDVAWTIFTPEHFYLDAVVRALNEDDSGDESPEEDLPQVDLFCMPDLPEGEFDTVVFATEARSVAELTRDLLQQIADRLKPNGRLIISTDNPRDHWLHEQLRTMFGRTTVKKDKRGTCYIARKGAGPKKRREFRAEFAFRDGETLIRCASRPGVFSHRRVDAGARALLRSLELLNDASTKGIMSPRRIVELGCGCGAVAVAAALRFPEASVLAVDSHARAVQSTEQTARLNNAANVAVMLTSNGILPHAGTYELFLTNPPYYSDFRISELFLQSAEAALTPGGRLHLVTKLTEWHRNRMTEIFGNVDVHRYGDYDVLCSVR